MSEIVKRDGDLILDLTQGLSLEGLTEGEKQSLLTKVQGARFDLAKDVAQRKVKLQSSSVDMDVTVNTANRLERGKSDYHITSSHETASGRTEIKVSRNTNNGILVVIVIIGIVLILVLAKALQNGVGV